VLRELDLLSLSVLSSISRVTDKLVALFMVCVRYYRLTATKGVAKHIHYLDLLEATRGRFANGGYFELLPRFGGS